MIDENYGKGAATEHVIDNPTHRVATPDEIRTKWLNAINDRLSLDCTMTNVAKYGTKAIKAKLVESTWAGVLEKEGDLTPEWVLRKVEVLGGIKPL